LRDSGYDKGNINAIANFCFLTSGSNKQISSRLPQDYLSDIAEKLPGVLESQWIPTDPALWAVDRYPDFLTERRRLLAGATNDLLAELLAGYGRMASEQSPPVAVTPIYEHDDRLTSLVELTKELGLAQPKLDHEIVDDASREILAIADAVWPDGLQTGLTQPLAFLLEPDEQMEARLGELGYRFYAEYDKLVWHLEEVTGVDIDADGSIGEPGGELTQYWTQLLDIANARTELHAAVAPKERSYLRAGAGRSGLTFQYYANEHEAKATFWMYPGSGAGESAEQLFRHFEAARNEIEDAFGASLQWDASDVTSRKIIAAVPEAPGFGVAYSERRPGMIALVDAMIRLEEALRPHIDRLER
jgi:hypothetical protein